MTLLENLLQNGKTFKVSNAQKGGNMEDKVINLSLPTSSKVTISSDLILTVKDYQVVFTLGSKWFASQPELDKKGVGLTPIFYEDRAFLFLCKDGVPNNLHVVPLFLNAKKGSKKSLTFKSQALDLSVRKVKEIDFAINELHHFKLVDTGTENLFEILEATLDVGVNVNDLEKQVAKEASTQIEDTQAAPSETVTAPILEDTSVGSLIVEDIEDLDLGAATNFTLDDLDAHANILIEQAEEESVENFINMQ